MSLERRLNLLNSEAGPPARNLLEGELCMVIDLPVSFDIDLVSFVVLFGNTN
jgi:hypothetical protein